MTLVLIVHRTMDLFDHGKGRYLPVRPDEYEVLWGENPDIEAHCRDYLFFRWSQRGLSRIMLNRYTDLGMITLTESTNPEIMCVQPD